VILNIQVKNAYDANYTQNGYKFHPTASANKAFKNVTVAIHTVNGTTSNTAVGDLGGSGYSFNFVVASDGKLTNWAVPAGAATPPPPSSGFFTADNPGNIPYDAGGLSPGTAPYLQTTFNNTYDAASKTFYMHYGYGAGSSDQTGWSRNFYFTLVRQ
jgi:hypothetical protein